MGGYNFVDMTNLDDDPVLLSGQNFYKFREVDVRLPAKTDEVMMTTNSLVFAVKPQTNREFLQNLPRLEIKRRRIKKCSFRHASALAEGKDWGLRMLARSKCFQRHP